MDTHPPGNSREHYRLRYPLAERPAARIADHDYAVAEVSEGGVRIVIASVPPVVAGETLTGVMRFRGGETVSIEGVVLRLDGMEMVVALSKGVTQKQMLAEQIRIRKKYPMFFETIKAATENESQ